MSGVSALMSTFRQNSQFAGLVLFSQKKNHICLTQRCVAIYKGFGLCSLRSRRWNIIHYSGAFKSYRWL